MLILVILDVLIVGRRQRRRPGHLTVRPETVLILRNTPLESIHYGRELN